LRDLWHDGGVLVEFDLADAFVSGAFKSKVKSFNACE
jgi:hypothetical protein